MLTIAGAVTATFPVATVDDNLAHSLHTTNSNQVDIGDKNLIQGHPSHRGAQLVQHQKVTSSDAPSPKRQATCATTAPRKVKTNNAPACYTPTFLSKAPRVLGASQSLSPQSVQTHSSIASDVSVSALPMYQTRQRGSDIAADASYGETAGTRVLSASLHDVRKTIARERVASKSLLKCIHAETTGSTSTLSPHVQNRIASLPDIILSNMRASQQHNDPGEVTDNNIVAHAESSDGSDAVTTRRRLNHPIGYSKMDLLHNAMKVVFYDSDINSHCGRSDEFVTEENQGTDPPTAAASSSLELANTGKYCQMGASQNIKLQHGSSSYKSLSATAKAPRESPSERCSKSKLLSKQILYNVPDPHKFSGGTYNATRTFGAGSIAMKPDDAVLSRRSRGVVRLAKDARNSPNSTGNVFTSVIRGESDSVLKRVCSLADSQKHLAQERVSSAGALKLSKIVSARAAHNTGRKHTNQSFSSDASLMSRAKLRRISSSRTKYVSTFSHLAKDIKHKRGVDYAPASLTLVSPRSISQLSNDGNGSHECLSTEKISKYEMATLTPMSSNDRTDRLDKESHAPSISVDVVRENPQALSELRTRPSDTTLKIEGTRNLSCLYSGGVKERNLALSSTSKLRQRVQTSEHFKASSLLSSNNTLKGKSSSHNHSSRGRSQKRQHAYKTVRPKGHHMNQHLQTSEHGMCSLNEKSSALLELLLKDGNPKGRNSDSHICHKRRMRAPAAAAALSDTPQESTKVSDDAVHIADARNSAPCEPLLSKVAPKTCSLAHEDINQTQGHETPRHIVPGQSRGAHEGSHSTFHKLPLSKEIPKSTFSSKSTCYTNQKNVCESPTSDMPSKTLCLKTPDHIWLSAGAKVAPKNRASLKHGCLCMDKSHQKESKNVHSTSRELNKSHASVDDVFRADSGKIPILRQELLRSCGVRAGQNREPFPNACHEGNELERRRIMNSSCNQKESPLSQEKAGSMAQDEGINLQEQVIQPARTDDATHLHHACPAESVCASKINSDSSLDDQKNLVHKSSFPPGGSKGTRLTESVAENDDAGCVTKHSDTTPEIQAPVLCDHDTCWQPPEKRTRFPSESLLGVFRENCFLSPNDAHDGNKAVRVESSKQSTEILPDVSVLCGGGDGCGRPVAQRSEIPTICGLPAMAKSTDVPEVQREGTCF